LISSSDLDSSFSNFSGRVEAAEIVDDIAREGREDGVAVLYADDLHL
jgi:hypothetical protein